MMIVAGKTPSIHSPVATASLLPANDPAGWIRVVIDELALYISDGSTYNVYPAPAAPFAFSARSVQKQDDSKLNEMQSQIETMQKSIQSAYDLMAQAQKPQNQVQLVAAPVDESKIDEIRELMKHMNADLVHLYEQQEKYDAEIDSLHAQIVARDKQIEAVEDTLSHHAVKLDRATIVSPQFANVVQFLLWLFTFGYISPKQQNRNEA